MDYAKAVCEILKSIKGNRIPDPDALGLASGDYADIIEGMTKRELIKEAFIIKAADGSKSVLMTNAHLTFHGETFLAEECQKGDQ